MYAENDNRMLKKKKNYEEIKNKHVSGDSVSVNTV